MGFYFLALPLSMQSATVCNAQVMLVDVDTNEKIMLGNTDLTIIDTSTNITFSTQLLRQNRHYTTSVTASNAAGLAVSITEISKILATGFNCYYLILITGTHAIREVAIVIVDDQIIIKTDYFEHSSASGALYIFVPLDVSGAVDLTRTVYLALDRNTSQNYMLPFSLSGERVAVFVYDIESNGTLASGLEYPAVENELIYENGQGIVCLFW